MAENLMETQTGGAGETVQLAPETPVTPEQFDVQLPNVGQQQQTAAPVPADSEPPAAPPVEPPSTPPSPVIQQSMLEAEKQVQDEQAGQAVEQPQGPLVSQLPFSAAKQPVEAGVGYVDWFSGDVTKSIEDEESKVIDSLMNEPDLVQPQVITQNEIEEINEQQKDGPIILDGVMIGGSMPLDEDEEDVMPSFAVDDSEEDERFQNFTLDEPGYLEQMKRAGLDPDELIPKGYTPSQWASHKREIQAKYPGYTIVVSDDRTGAKVVKEEIQQQKPLKDKPLGEKPVKNLPANQEIFNKIMPYPKNPGVDYMTDGTHWYKKRSGTNNPWLTITNDGSITTLNKHFKTNIPNVKRYSYPNKPYEYAVIKGNWNIRKKGDTQWKVIYQPERIKVLNGSFNKKLGVPIKMTKAEMELNRAAANLKQAGMNMNSPKLGAVTTDGNGGVLMSGINNAMSTASSTMEAGGLFSAPTRPSLIPGSVRVAENVSTENISNIEKNRKLQIDYVNNNPNLSPEKKKAQIDLINKESNALVNKEKSSVQGAKEYEKEVTKQVFTAPLPKEITVKKEIDISDQLNKQFGINIHKDNIPLIDTNLGLVDRFTEQQKQETLQSAQNFADKDLDAWRKTPQGRMLDDEQFKDLKEAQMNTKRLIQLGGDNADFSLYGMSTLNSQVEGVYNSYKTSVDTNNKINQASVEGKSMDEFLLDNKKKLVKEIDINNEAIVHAKELFNATAAIHDFVTPYIKSGKVTIDKNGMYRISPKANAQDKKYLEDKLGQLMNKYDELKNGSYNTYQDDIVQLRNKKKIVNGMLVNQRKELAKAKKGTPEYDAIVKKINATKKRISDIDGKLDNLNNSSRAFFSTDAKGVFSEVSSFMKISGFNAKFLASSSKLTPKQRFDIAYESIQEENKALALKAGVRSDYLYSVGARVRSMLDWNALGVELSPDEKKFFANQKILNQLLPYYLNNENGITEESAEFWNSFLKSAKSFVVGKDITGAEGRFTGTDQVNTALEAMIDLGFTKEDLANPMAIKDLEDRRNVSLMTREFLGETLGVTAAMVAEIAVTQAAGAGVLSLSKKLANLVKAVDATGDAIGYGDKIAKLYQSYATVMSRSRFGRYTFDAVEQGALFEATSEFFGSSEGEMNFLAGFAGSFAGSAMSGLMGRIPASKALPIVKSIFGDKTDDAIRVFKKAGELNATGLGETAEETGQELANIYQNRLEGEGFFEAVGNRFGSFDEVMKFVVSSYVMGAGFGLIVPKRAQEAYNSMSKEDKNKVDNAITAVRKDFEDASAAYNNAAEVLTEEIEIDLQLNAEPETEADIDSKQENAGTLLNGEPTPEAEGKIQEGEVTEAEVEQKKEDDTKDEAGLPSEVREGEKPVETKPFPEASEEEAGPSGVVQEEQEVAPIEEGLQFDLPRAGEEVAPKEGELQFELPKGETEVQEGVTESTLTREFDLTEEQVVEEATEQVADIMADEKLSEEQKEEKIDEVVVKTNKRKTAAKMRKGEKQLFPEPSKQLKEEIKAKAEPMVEEKKAEREEVKDEIIMPKKPKLFVSGMAQGWRVFNKYNKYQRDSRIEAEGPGDQRARIENIDNGFEKPLSYAGKKGIFFFMSNGFRENKDKNYLILSDARLREYTGGKAGRNGNLSVSVEIDKNASQEEVRGAMEYLYVALKRLHPYTEGGVITERNESRIEEEIVDFETKVASSLLEYKVRERKARKEKEEAEAKSPEASEKVKIRKDAYLSMYDEIPAKNKRKRQARLDFIRSQQSSIDEDDRIAAKLAYEEIESREAKPETKAPVETKAEAPSLSKKDQEEIKFLDEQIQSTEMRIEDLQEEIQIEKGNLKEEKERIKEEKAKVRSSKMSRDEKQERLEELDSELEDIVNDHDDLVQGYKDDISQEKSDLRKYNRDKNKITEKAKAATPAETKTEAPAVETKEKSVYDEDGSFTNEYAEQLLENVVNSAGPRQMSSLTRNLRKAGWDISYGYEQSGLSMSTAIGDSLDLMKREYGVFTKEEKAQATRVLSDMAKRAGIEIEQNVKTTSNPFDDLSSVTKLPSRSPKRKQAIADFDAKHGEGAYERVSKIDAKFGEITKKLEDNKVIKKDC